MKIIAIEILKFFLENPYQEIYLREFSRKLKLSPATIKKYLDYMVKEELIAEEKKANLRYFKAKTSSSTLKHVKIAYNIHLIQKSELIEFIKQNVPNTSSITLFGSIAKGEDDKNSDIDLVIIGKEKHLDLKHIAEKINREVKPHIVSWSEWNKKAKKDEPFYYEVISHGIPLYGELPMIRWK